MSAVAAASGHVPEAPRCAIAMMYTIVEVVGAAGVIDTAAGELAAVLALAHQARLSGCYSSRSLSVAVARQNQSRNEGS